MILMWHQDSKWTLPCKFTKDIWSSFALKAPKDAASQSPFTSPWSGHHHQQLLCLYPFTYSSLHSIKKALTPQKSTALSEGQCCARTNFVPGVFAHLDSLDNSTQCSLLHVKTWHILMLGSHQCFLFCAKVETAKKWVQACITHTLVHLQYYSFIYTHLFYYL